MASWSQSNTAEHDQHSVDNEPRADDPCYDEAMARRGLQVWLDLVHHIKQASVLAE